jgi:hypothetical protein
MKKLPVPTAQPMRVGISLGKGCGCLRTFLRSVRYICGLWVSGLSIHRAHSVTAHARFVGEGWEGASVKLAFPVPDKSEDVGRGSFKW